MKKIASRSLLPLIGVLLVIAVVMQARAMRGERTPAIPATHRPAPVSRIVAEGKVVTYPGMEVAVGTDIAGVVERILVKERDQVTRGQLLAELRNDDLHASLAEANARVREADADVRLAQLEQERADDLWKKEVGSRQAVDGRQRDLEASVARRETAAATVRRLEAMLQKTRIFSPIDGIVIRRDVDRGEAVKEGSELLTIADVHKLRVQAEIDEYDIDGIRAGEPVSITAEGFRNQQWSGKVEEVPDSVVPRRLRSQDPSRPTDTAVLLVKIAFDQKTPLKLGQRVDVVLREGK